MIFNVGDRIQSTEGVCPGSYGIIDSIKSDYGGRPGDIVYRVTYDSGRTDTIYGRMLVIVERGEEYDTDE